MFFYSKKRPYFLRISISDYYCRTFFFGLYHNTPINIDISTTNWNILAFSPIMFISWMHYPVRYWKSNCQFKNFILGNQNGIEQKLGFFSSMAEIDVILALIFFAILIDFFKKSRFNMILAALPSLYWKDMDFWVSFIYLYLFQILNIFT